MNAKQWYQRRRKMEKSKDKKKEVGGRGLLDQVFSWTLKEVLDEDLHKGKVGKIPEIFTHPNEYLKSFIKPLIEETHYDLYSSMTSTSTPPVCEVLSVRISKGFRLPSDLFYNFILKAKTSNNKEKTFLKKKNDKEKTYSPEVGDLIALTDLFPRSIDDLKGPERPFLAYVQAKSEQNPDSITVFSSKSIEFRGLPNNRFRVSNGNDNVGQLFVVYLMNMVTNLRIYRALNSELEGCNMNVIKNVLGPNSKGGNCDACSSKVMHSDEFSHIRSLVKASDSNDSQESAILSSIVLRVCKDQNSVNLIWGPPGTGKTKTIGQLLFCLLKLKCRTLTCAPTNIAVLTVTERLFNKVFESLEYDTYGLGDIILFGNKERLNMDKHYDLLDVFLDYRADILAKCFAPFSGYRHNLEAMIGLLEDPHEKYRVYLTKQEDKEKEDDGLFGNAETRNDHGEDQGRSKEIWKQAIVEAMKTNKNKDKDKQDKGKSQGKGHSDGRSIISQLTFKEFVLKRFRYIWDRLQFCMVNLYTHLPTSLISVQVVKNMVSAAKLLRVLEALLRQVSVSDERLKQVFDDQSYEGGRDGHIIKLSNTKKVCLGLLELIPDIGLKHILNNEERSRDVQLIKFRNIRKECLHTLESLPRSFAVPSFGDSFVTRNFCLSNACLIFCTASTSVKLHTKGITPVELLVIDEAAQLKECESAIPLQLSGLRHAILIGDEQQLSPMVQSEISKGADFGRSLFQRLVQLGHKKHLLNVQYRMHPSISSFPNREFYNSQISDADAVKDQSYEKQYLGGNMFGPFSFINIAHGMEQKDGGGSTKNMVEVAVVAALLASLFKEFVRTKRKISIGVISPYNAQVYAIQDKIGNSYNPHSGSDFTVNVRSVDGFQGSEEDVIIFSTVRSNRNGNLGFLSNHQRTNVALTRAKYCLWVLGNGETLKKSDTIWKRLVMNAKKRGCFHEADKDDRLAKAISDSLLELDQLGTLLRMDSPLFRKSKWKVCFSDEFWKSIERMNNIETRRDVLSLLVRLSSGWRQPQRDRSFVALEGASSQLVEQYKVNNTLSLVWSVDIEKEGSRARCVQVLMVWNVLSLEDIPKLAEPLNRVFQGYAVNKMNRCKAKSSEGNLVVPLKWHETDAVELLSKPFASLSVRDGSEATSSNPRNHNNYNTRGRGRANGIQKSQRQLGKRK